MNEKIQLQSGAMLEMTFLDFETAMQLLSAVSEELLKVNVDLGNIDLSDLTGSEMDNNIINTLKNVVLTMVVSKNLREMLNVAFARCTYNGAKINADTFEKVEARKDYFVVCWEVLKFNLLPFLPGIGSSFLTNLGMTGSTPKQK
jgi:hypothetical protein